MIIAMSTSKKSVANTTETSVVQPANAAHDRQLWRDLVAFWFLGLCNNYGYVVMLSAAHDILEHFNKDTADASQRDDQQTGTEKTRVCNIISTGAILLTDIIPSMAIMAVAPFLPFYIHVRVIAAIGLQVVGFVMVAYANGVGQWLAICGVVLTSLSSGLGETSFLAYSARFNKNVVSTWSSGTGGASVIGSISYAGLIQAGLSSKDTMLIMIVVPVVEAVAFWVVLRRPAKGREERTEERPLVGLCSQLRYVRTLFKYIVPLFLVYFLQYLINQGLIELIYLENAGMSKADQYRWLQVDYQIGVFISRSSVNIITVDKIWLMAIFQAINVVILLSEVIVWYMPSIWIVFAIVLWEGLLGGGAYVNTFYRMSKELPEERRLFALGVVPVGNTVGIGLAGAVAIPMHNALCALPRPR